jgi:Zn-dependent peptidase ImmA (M78 family)
MVLKVPFLADRQLESAAQELLRRYAKWKGALPKPPIPVEDIVEGLLELTLSIGDLCGRLGKSDVLGATWLDDGHVMIDSSLEGNEGRFSFTLAHETGHWVLHRPIIEMEKVTVPLFAREPNSKPAPAIVCRDGQRDPAEIQADRFAAYLLMPAADVRAATKTVSDQPLVVERLEERRKAGEALPELKRFAADVIERGSFSNVSNQAMQIRLVNLKLAIDLRGQTSLF